MLKRSVQRVRKFCFGGWWRGLVFCLISGSAIFLHSGVVYALDTCYAVADTRNMFVSLDKITGKTTLIGNTGRPDIESLAFRDGTETLYATDGGEFGTINLVTGHFMAIGRLGTGNGSAGVVTIDDVDGLSWDSATNTLYGVQRRTGDAADLLFQIDVTTGALKPGAFNGADYVPVGISRKIEDNIDDLTFNPVTGILYGLANQGGGSGTLVTIDKNTGAIQEIGTLLDAADATNIIEEMEGLSFFNDGRLYGSTGEEGLDAGDNNHLYNIDLTTATATRIGKFPAPYTDYEALACLTATIADDDKDGIINAGEDINNDNNLANDDTDGDGAPNYTDPDDDDDTVPTSAEDPTGDGSVLKDDTDGDGKANYLDDDDDDDGDLTKNEDPNQDNNPTNDDQDADTIPNYLEGGDSDSDGKANQIDPDDDGDGLLTTAEDLNRDGNLWNDNSDGDSKVNYLDADDDGDGIPTLNEDGNRDGSPANDDADADNIPNYLDNDADGDRILDSEEWSHDAQDPLHDCLSAQPICFNNDADGDGLFNFLDQDTDSDGVPDQEEVAGDTNGNGIPNWLDATSTQRGLYLPLIRKTDLLETTD